MNNSESKCFSPLELAERWNVHRASVPRIMARYGISGMKFGAAKQAARRFSADDVARVESLAKLHPARKANTNSGNTVADTRATGPSVRPH